MYSIAGLISLEKIVGCGVVDKWYTSNLDCCNSMFCDRLPHVYNFLIYVTFYL